MSNYVKATNFQTKDGLTTGDPLKIISGTELNAEFNAIQTAVNSKSNTNSPTFTGAPAAPTAAQGTNTTQLATTAFVEAEAVLTASQVTAVAVAADLVIDTAYKLADTALGVRIDNNTHAQSSGAEITAGTETELRSNSPADIVSYITQHTTPGLGVDQTWQDMMSSRSSGVTYTNSSGRPIMVTCNAYGSGSPANGQVTFLINGDRVSLSGGGAIASGAIGDSPSYIIPNGDTYQATFVGPYIEWWELRA